MKIKTLLFYSAILSTLVFQSYGQKAQIASADKKYDQYAYVDAISVYKRIAEKGYKDENMFQKLGNAYYFNAELVEAFKWYDQLFEMNPNQQPEYLYRYSQTLKSVGNYAKADKILAEFNTKLGNDLRGKLYENNKNYLEQIKANSNRFDITDAGINSAFSDYGSTFLGNKLVFASARDTGGVSKKVFKWNNQSFTDLYESEILSDTEMGKPVRFGNKINSKFHESTPVFTKDGKTMYFTRNNYLDGKRGKDGQRVTLLKIYKASLVDGKWANEVELPFDSNNYSVAHPALSLDEKTLYFASDMPGTLGQSDLYRVQINSDDTYGTPENLGKTINTEGRESFPFISGDNDLYFASDGRPGLGGLDVYVSKIGKDNSFGEVQNVGAPINCAQDDFAFLMDSKTRKGFFTSNRAWGNGYDDIYRFTELPKLTCEQLLSGIMTDKETGVVLADSKISLFNEKFDLLKETTSDDKGNYTFDVECGKSYSVRAQKEEYETKEVKVQIADETGKTDLAIQLEKRIKPVTVGTDLAKTFEIPMIHFDLDKSAIRKDAALELEKVLAVLQQYPEMKIAIGSHTDSRASTKYNEALSERRAQSTKAWLVKNGIDANRMTAKGYGESKLLNGCSDGVKCSEEEHQANRRSEFIITSL